MRAILVGLVVLVGASAWAISETDFGAFLKRNTGITDFPITTKRACQCEGRVGLTVLEVDISSGEPYLTCVIPKFAADGHEISERECFSAVSVLGR